jgi:hypothetical protein
MRGMLLRVRLEVEEGAGGEVGGVELVGVDVGGENEGGGKAEGDMVEFRAVEVCGGTEMEGVGDIDSGVEVRFGELVGETPRLLERASPSGSEPIAVLGAISFLILYDERGSGFCSLRKCGRESRDLLDENETFCKMIFPAYGTGTDSALEKTVACCRQRSWGLTNSQGGSYKGF